eukprot:GEMP01031526.1.p1 GENE.GEMP01031526.1~~GEMP01031526.1.p1  ORF type:complete len:378 (+),score=65.92 GEMP01031526.1:121-1254(+)
MVMANAIRSAARKSVDAKFQKQFFKTSMCTKFEAGECNRGQYCKFAHSPEDVRSRPCLDKTKMCPALETCARPNCLFAHSRDELVATNNFAKTKLCHFGEKCKSGNKCRYAHSANELAKKNKNVNFQQQEERRENIRLVEHASSTEISWTASIKKLASSVSGAATFDMRTNSRGSSLYGSPHPVLLNLLGEHEANDGLSADGSHDPFYLTSHPPVVPSLLEMVGQQNTMRASNNTMMVDGRSSNVWMGQMMLANMHEQPQSPMSYSNMALAPMYPQIGSPMMINAALSSGFGSPFMMNRPSESPSAASGMMVPSPVASGNPCMMRNVFTYPLGSPTTMGERSSSIMQLISPPELSPRLASTYTAQELDNARPAFYED